MIFKWNANKHENGLSLSSSNTTTTFPPTWHSFWLNVLRIPFFYKVPLLLFHKMPKYSNLVHYYMTEASCKYSRLVCEIFGWTESNEISFSTPKHKTVLFNLTLHKKTMSSFLSVRTHTEHKNMVKKRLPQSSNTQKKWCEEKSRL